MTTLTSSAIVDEYVTSAEPLYIEKFLKELNCEHYLERFVNYQLTNESEIKYVDKDILLSLGITKLGDRIRIMKKINGLKKKKVTDHSHQLDEILKKFSQLSTNGTNVTNDDLISEKHQVMFILNDGSVKKINVNGCFNADSIKKRLLKCLPKELLAAHPLSKGTIALDDYDIFIVDYSKNVLHLLYDVELVTICHSSDRVEKNRLIFVSKDQTPSEEAIQTSKKIYFITLSHLTTKKCSQNKINSLRIDNRKDKIRKIFDQRPPSELISTNLTGYFPETNIRKLEKTLRESYRQSVRLSTIGHISPNPESNKVGDILLKHSNAVDIALLKSLNVTPHNDKDLHMREHGKHSKQGDKKITNTNDEKSTDLLELYDDDDGELEEEGDIVSLPTKIATPKSWLKGARIGSGSFGNVHLGMNAQTGELMAVKQVRIQPSQNVPQSNGNGNKTEEAINAQQLKASHMHKKMVDALQHEMNLLKELHHENIVTYYGSSQESGNLNIFLEYVPGGSVSSMLNSYGPFEESLIINFTRQILIGVAYLHKKNIIHRDIKGANILIDIKGCVKITDFGISKKLSPLNKKQNKRASLQGSVFWMAPEVVKQTATTEKVDIWSTGCVIIEMFTGKHPFPDFSQMQAIFKIGTDTTPEIPSWATEEGKDFMQQTFKMDYRTRPSAIELLQHSWLDTNII